MFTSRSSSCLDLTCSVVTSLCTAPGGRKGAEQGAGIAAHRAGASGGGGGRHTAVPAAEQPRGRPFSPACGAVRRHGLSSPQGEDSLPSSQSYVQSYSTAHQQFTRGPKESL